jgi:hypothetical protein
MMLANDIPGALDNLQNAPTGNSLAIMGPIYKRHGQIAASHGWELVAYEGGLHLDAKGLKARPDYQQIEKQLIQFFTAVSHDPGRAKVDEANLAALEAAGCTLACPYNLDGAPSEFGVFGHYGTPGWDVLQARIKAAAPVPTPTPPPVVVTPDPIPLPPKTPTKAEILADIDALKAKIVAMG